MPLKIYLPLGLLSIAATFTIACTNNRSADETVTSLEESKATRDILKKRGETIDDAIATGFKYAEKNDPKALLVADSLITLGKTNVDIANGFYLKGIYFANINNTDKAIACFDSSILNNYTFTEPYIEKAILRYESKKFDLAIDLLSKASQLDRYNPEIYYWMAKNYESQKNQEEALFYYEQTLVLDPNFNDAKDAIEHLKTNPKTTDKK